MEAAAALSVPAEPERRLLGELLVEAGHLTSDQLEAALNQQQEFGRRVAGDTR